MNAARNTGSIPGTGAPPAPSVGATFRQLLDELPVGMFTAGCEGIVTFCNPALPRLLGFPSVDALMERPILDLFVSLDDAVDFLHGMASDRSVDSWDVELKRHDGLPVACRISAWNSNAEWTPWIAGIVEARGDGDPVHEHALTEPMAPRAVDVLLDLGGNVLEINDAGARLLGEDPQTLLGKPLHELFYPMYRDLFTLFLSEAFEAGHREGVLNIKDRAGSFRKLEFSTSKHCGGGTSPGIRILAREIGSDQPLQAACDERFRGVLEMAGGVAHSLNQPLTVINSIVHDLLEAMAPQDPLFPQVQEIERQVSVLNSIGRKMGRISRYEVMDYVAGVRIVDIDRSS